MSFLQLGDMPLLSLSPSASLCCPTFPRTPLPPLILSSTGLYRIIQCTVWWGAPAAAPASLSAWSRTPDQHGREPLAQYSHHVPRLCWAGSTGEPGQGCPSAVARPSHDVSREPLWMIMNPPGLAGSCVFCIRSSKLRWNQSDTEQMSTCGLESPVEGRITSLLSKRCSSPDGPNYFHLVCFSILDVQQIHLEPFVTKVMFVLFFKWFQCLEVCPGQ